MRFKRSRRPEWLAVWGALLCVLTWYALEHWVPGQRPVAGLGRPGTDWFTIVRLPELPKDETGIAAQKRRLADWLDAVRAAGLQPMLLSEAVHRLRRGDPLPDRAVVFVYTNSFRLTVDEVRPLFEERNIPAVWLTSRAGLADRDQRFLSRHHWALLKRSRQWDMGTHDASSRTFVLEGRGAPADTFTWEEREEGRWGLNRAADLPRLRFLNVQRSWTGRDLADRVMAQQPLRDRARLTAVRVFQWQLGVPVYDAQTPRTFELSSPPHRRSGAVRWLGAEAAADGAFQVEAAEVVGELWVGVRIQPDESGVRVGFTEDRWVIETRVDGRDRRLAVVGWPYAKKRAIKAVVVWRGDRVLVRAAGTSREVEIPGAGRWRGPLELVVYHKIRGVALARGVSAMLVPIPPLELGPAVGSR